MLHHEESEHVVAATPVDYTTEQMKTWALNQLGWIGLGYPEYFAGGDVHARKQQVQVVGNKIIQGDEGVVVPNANKAWGDISRYRHFYACYVVCAAARVA